MKILLPLAITLLIFLVYNDIPFEVNKIICDEILCCVTAGQLGSVIFRMMSMQLTSLYYWHHKGWNNFLKVYSPSPPQKKFYCIWKTNPPFPMILKTLPLYKHRTPPPPPTIDIKTYSPQSQQRYALCATFCNFKFITKQFENGSNL